MSAPWGCTETSAREKSLSCTLFQCAIQAARSNACPLGVTPTNVGARWYSASFQSLSRIACHIRRSYCSAPVAFFQEGCLGARPIVQPVMQSTITTEDTKEHKNNKSLCRPKTRKWCRSFELIGQPTALKSLRPKLLSYGCNHPRGKRYPLLPLTFDHLSRVGSRRPLSKPQLQCLPCSKQSS